MVFAAVGAQRPSALVILFLLWPIAVVRAAGSCATLKPLSTCDGVLDYSSVYFPDGTCQDSQENVAARLGGVMAVLSSSCRAAAARYQCANLFPRCETAAGGAVSGKPLCPSVCTAAASACSAFEKSVILSQIGISLPSDCDLIAPAVSPACYDAVNPAFTQKTEYTHCEPYSGSICAGVVDYPIIVPAHSTQSDLELQLAPSLSAVWIAPPGKCLNSLIKYLCSRAFLPCDTTVVKRGTGFDIAAPFPRLPCQSVCQTFARECADWLNSNPALAALVPVCNSTGLYSRPVTSCGAVQTAGGPDFPVNETIFSAAPLLTTACNSWIDLNATIANGGVATDRATAYTVQCPSPLVIPDERAVAHGYVNPIGGSCAIPCPVPLFTRAEYKYQEPILTSFTFISIITNAFLILSWLVFPERRKQEYLIMFITSSFFSLVGFSFGAALPTADETELLIARNTCGSNVELMKSGDDGFSYCLFTAVFRQFFSLGALFWWNVQALDILLKMTYSRGTLPSYLRWVYHCTVWGLCLLLTVYPLAVGGLGPSNLFPECAIADDQLNWYLFYLPLGIVIVLGTVFVGAILYQLFRSSALTKTKDWRFHRSMMFILLLFDGVFLVPLIYRIITYYSEDEIEASTTEWVTCLLSTTAGESERNAICGDHPSVRPEIGGFIFVLSLSASVGLIAFLVYGSRADLYIEWAQLLGCRSARDARVTEMSTAPTAGTGGGGTTTEAGAYAVDIPNSKPRKAAVSARGNTTATAPRLIITADSGAGAPGGGGVSARTPKPAPSPANGAPSVTIAFTPIAAAPAANSGGAESASPLADASHPFAPPEPAPGRGTTP